MRISPKKTIPATVFSLMLGSHCFAQGVDVLAISTQLSEFENRYKQIQIHKKQLMTSADSLAEIISKLKAKERRSFVEERELENQLRLSQALAGRTQTAYQNEALLLHNLTQFAETAFKNLNEAVKNLTEDLRSARRQKDTEQMQRLTHDLQQATQVRARCQGYLASPPGNLSLINIQISASDSPKQIDEKADFLLDQSDRFRNAAQQIDKKLVELADEIELRHRLADFVDDLAAFDPSSETVSGASGRAGAVVEESTQLNDAGSRNAATQAFSLSQPAMNWPANISNLSTDALEKWQKQLKARQRTLAAQADSLAEQSTIFRKTLKSKQQ